MGEERARKPETIRALTWNLDWWNTGERAVDPLALLEGHGADVALVQEVRGRRLRDHHAGPSLFSQDLYPPANWAWMGCGILPRPGAEVLDSGVVDTLPKPQRSIWARVRLPGGAELTAVSWHSPNRAGDGLDTKMAAFAAMSAWLAAAPGPVVLGADLNTWTDPVDLVAPADGEEHWDEAAFVGPSPAHGLVDAWRTVLDQRGELANRRAAGGDGPLAVSYVLSSGAEHRMDRIFASPHLGVRDGGYDRDGAIAAGSDHALHWIDFDRP